MLETLGQVLPSTARQFGNKAALIVDQDELSFTDLERLSNQAANMLARLGVSPGAVVSLYAGNCWQWIVAYYAILKLGAVVNPINVMLTAEEVKFIANDCNATVLLASSERAMAIEKIRAETPLCHILVFGMTVPEGMQSFDNGLAAECGAFAPASVKPSSLCTIGYTSGTTGRPKGAMLSHTAVLLNSSMTANMHVRTESDSVVTGLPCAHVYGNVVMNGAFLTGMTLILMQKFDAVGALTLIARHRATMFEGVPTMYMYMLNTPDLAQYDLSSLRRCTVGGQTMPTTKMQEVEERFGCPLLELWGMTEIAGLGTTHPLYGRNRHGSIGIPLPYVECRIADVKDPTITLPEGEVGELMVRGPIVMQGYLGNPSATRETIEPDGWLHSGDLANSDEDGYIFIVDRKKDMINTAGFKVYPAEIERVVAAHPAVAMVAVGSMPDDVKGETAKAYVVLRSGATCTSDEILSHCRQHLAAYKIPRDVQFVPDLPKTSTGKVMRRALSAPNG